MRVSNKSKTLLPAALGLALLILDSRTAIEGAQAGVDVCIRSVLPTLFPFIFLSSALTDTLRNSSLKWGRILCSLYKVPYGTEGILLAGLTGGYPIGAKCIHEGVSQGNLLQSDAERMLVFCNAAGPAFIFGIIGTLFDKWWIPWCLWGIHLSSSLCIAHLWPPISLHTSAIHSIPSRSAPQRLRQSIFVIGDICGWIILTRTAISFARKWALQHLPKALEMLIVGILELTNGCISLSAVENSGLRFLICASLLSFGGLCVTLQTRSVASVVNQRKYLPRKCVQALFSFIVAYIIQHFFFPAEEKAPLPWLFTAALMVFVVVIIHSRIKTKKLWKFRGT